MHFIPVAEEAGLVNAMFWALLAQACRRALGCAGEFMLAVNISPSKFETNGSREGFAYTARNGFPAQRLEIE